MPGLSSLLPTLNPLNPLGVNMGGPMVPGVFGSQVNDQKYKIYIKIYYKIKLLFDIFKIRNQLFYLFSHFSISQLLKFRHLAGF